MQRHPISHFTRPAAAFYEHVYRHRLVGLSAYRESPLLVTIDKVVRNDSVELTLHRRAYDRQFCPQKSIKLKKYIDIMIVRLVG